MKENVYTHVIRFKRKGKYYTTSPYTSLKKQLSTEEQISICRNYLKALGIAYDDDIKLVLG